MSERILLVDYENIQAVDLEALPSDVNVRFVLGGKQASLPSALAVFLQQQNQWLGPFKISRKERRGILAAPDIAHRQYA